MLNVFGPHYLVGADFFGIYVLDQYLLAAIMSVCYGLLLVLVYLISIIAFIFFYFLVLLFLFFLPILGGFTFNGSIFDHLGFYWYLLFFFFCLFFFFLCFFLYLFLCCLIFYFLFLFSFIFFFFIVFLYISVFCSFSVLFFFIFFYIATFLDDMMTWSNFNSNSSIPLYLSILALRVFDLRLSELASFRVLSKTPPIGLR